MNSSKFSDIDKRVEHYIFSLKNIIQYTKFLPEDSRYHEEDKHVVLFNNGNFIPPQEDKLFWCFFVIKYGLDEYELLGTHTFEKEKQVKFEMIEKIRKKKDVLKANQFKPIHSFEDDLANNKVISLNTFMALLCLENKNITYIENKKMFHCCRNEEDMYILHKKENNVPYYELDMNVDKQKIDGLRDTHIIMPSFQTKLKAMSSYTLDELKEMCDKYDIVIPSNKKILKIDLYERIKVFF